MVKDDFNYYRMDTKYDSCIIVWSDAWARRRGCYPNSDDVTWSNLNKYYSYL